MSTRLAALNEGRRGARGQQAPQLFKGRVRKWEKKWINVDPPRGSSKVRLLKWVSEEPPQSQRSQVEQGEPVKTEEARPRYPHLRPVLDGDSQLDDETKSKLLAMTAEARELERGRRLAPRRSTRSQGADLEMDELTTLEGGRKRPRVDNATENSAQKPPQLNGNEYNDGDATDNTVGGASIAAEQQTKPTEMSVDPKTNEVEAHAVDDVENKQMEEKGDEIHDDNATAEMETEEKAVAEKIATGEAKRVDFVSSVKLAQEKDDSTTEEPKDLESTVEAEKMDSENEKQNAVLCAEPETQQKSGEPALKADAGVENQENKDAEATDIASRDNQAIPDVVQGHDDKDEDGKPDPKEASQKQDTENEGKIKQEDGELSNKKETQDMKVDVAAAAEKVQGKEADPQEKTNPNQTGQGDVKAPGTDNLSLGLDGSNLEPDNADENASLDRGATAVTPVSDFDKGKTEKTRENEDPQSIQASENSSTAEKKSEDIPPKTDNQEIPSSNIQKDS